MSSDETPKIEPKIEPVLSVTDAPPIVASVEHAKPENELKIEPKLEPKADIPTPEIPKAETLPEAPKLEKIEAKAEPKAEPKVETKTEFPKFELSASQAPNASAAPKITASATVIPLKKPEPAAAPAPQSRNTRFALLAACVAVAASFGAVGGSLGVAKFGPVISSAPVPAAPIAKEQIADEVKALKDTVAQLRATTNKLSDNFTALKTTVTTASAQNGKIAEALDRIEKSQAEQRKAATAAAAPAVSTTEVTGSIGQKQAAAPAAPAVPMVLGTPPTTLKPPAVPGFVLRRVYDGAALIEGRDGMIEVEPGMVAPGLGRVEAIKREDGRWVVVTARGIVR